MKLENLRIGVRHLMQEPGYSAIAILGLSIGLASCLLLLGFVQYCWHYDAQVPGVDQIYVVKQRFNVDAKAPWFDQAPLLLREAALHTPGVADASAFFRVDPPTVRIENTLQKMPSLLVLPHFAQLLGLVAVEGDLERALGRPEGLALTASSARRMFGPGPALGRTLQVGDKLLRVMAIMRDPPANTTIPFEALYGVASVLTSPEIRTEMQTGEHGGWGRVLLRIAPHADIDAISQALQAVLDKAPGVQGVPPDARARLGGRKVMELVLSPLREAYFDRDVARNPIGAPGDRGDRVTVAALALIALLIVAIAAINYVNLATVRVLRRQREIGMRKVLGASVRQIVLQFTAEALLVSMLATVMGLLLAWLALPLFGALVNRKLDAIFSGPNLGMALLLGVVIGIVAAIQPALTALRMRPAQALEGRANAESAPAARLRTMLTVLQIATAVGLASFALGISMQTNFAMHAWPGFDPGPLLIVDLPLQGKKNEAVRGFMSELGQHPGVKGIVLTEHVVGRFGNELMQDFKRDGRPGVSVDVKKVDTNFFDVYGLKPLAGRLFDPRIDKENDGVPVVLDPVAARQLGFASPEAAVGQTLQRTSAEGKLLTHHVVGIAPPVRFRTMHDQPGPTVYELGIEWAGTLSVRASASVGAAEQAVASLWPRYFPNALLQTQRAADVIAANYADDALLARLLLLASAVALALAAFGMYALSGHMVQRRSHEIVLRKVYGADRVQIGMLLGRDLGKLLLAAAALGLPLALVGVARYQAGFIERTSQAWATPWMALAGVAVIVLLAALRHGWHALILRPGQLLR